MDSKRIIVALVLSFAVFFGWQALFPPKSAKTTATEQVAQSTQGQTATQTAPAEGQAAPVPTVAEPEGMPAPADLTPTEGRQVTVATPLYTAVFDTQGGRLVSLKLAKYALTLEGNNEGDPADRVEMVVGNPTLGILIDDASTWQNAQWDESVADLSVDENGEGMLSFSGRVGQYAIQRTFTFSGATYLMREKIRVENTGEMRDVNVSVTGRTEALSTTASRFNRTQAAGFGPDGLIEESGEDTLREEGVGPLKSMAWGGLDNNYFIFSVLPESKEASMRAGLTDNGYWVTFTEGLGAVGAGQSESMDMRYYIGPMDRDALAKADPALSEAVDFGFFDFLAKPLLVFLVWLHDNVVANYGIAIIILTIIIKLIFWPLSQKSYKSMEKMKKLQPMVMKLREKHKGDKQKLNQETMQLYKTYKVNPAGGCLPMVVQIPVFFGLYKALLEALELRHAAFISNVPFTNLPWLADLSQPDPYYVTPVIMGLTMFLQQRMSPSTGDPTQRKIMMALPIVFTFLFLGFPSGLVVYWLCNNVLSIAQQYGLARSNKRKKESKV